MCVDYRVNLFFLPETEICDHLLTEQKAFQLLKKKREMHLCICPATHCLEFYIVVFVLIIFHTCV